MSAVYVPGDHESALGRDVVLAPPTCCCCCCCCTLAAPEIFVGRQFSRETQEAMAKAAAPESFWDLQLPFAAGALLANGLMSPIAGAVGFFGLAATSGLYGVLVLGALAAGVVLHTVRLGAKADNAIGGFFWGIVLCAILALEIAGELAIVLLIISFDDGMPAAALVALAAAVVVLPLIAIGMRKRREARAAAAAQEVTPPAPPPS